ncbi:MAG: LarC family nickel insertion protein, partial [Acidimicrobiales bacterium]|nr:LarC family nickel insertion protein [Acidimicrobiales bacterium]
MSAPTIAWFHCFSGVAGDMTLGALIDAGADLDEIRSQCDRLPVDGWELQVEPVLRGGIAATNVTVAAEESTVHRTAAHIIGLVEEARLPDRVAGRAIATFQALADAEGRLHRRPPEQVHFHEVGGLDSIIDIVGSCVALELLDVDDVACSAIATGTGMVGSAHGPIPNPAPATVALLAGIPTYGTDSTIELTTPTGAALMQVLATTWGPMPAMKVMASGFGAGDAKIDDRPNLLQVVLGERDTEHSAGQPVTLLETNVDDITGEQLADAVSALMAAGAH